MTGDILVDGPRMIAEGPAKDKVLWQYRTAAAAMRQAKFDVAKPLLDDALLTLRGIYGSDADLKAAKFKAIDSKSLTLALKTTPATTVKLEPAPEKDDPKGKASKFTATNDVFKKDMKWAGTLAGKVGNKPYSGDFKQK